MELKPGYKKTDVGVIPEDWDPIAASDLVDPNAPIRYGIVQVGRDTNGGIPIVAIKYVKEIDNAPLHKVSINLERRYERSRIKERDVLISIKGTIGRVGVVPKGFIGNISRDLARLRPRENYLPEYIAYQFEGDVTQARISSSVVGTTRFEFSIAALRKFELPIPRSFLEQQVIAGVLTDVDALLNGLERLIAKKRKLKQATMQQLLTGQTRLSGAWNVTPGYKRTEVGMIPNDWQTVTILGLCRQIMDYRGRTPKKLGMDWGGGDIPALSAANVKMGFIDFSEECYFASDALYRRWMTQGETAKDDIVFTTEAPLGNVALIPDNKKYILSQRTVLLQVNPQQGLSSFFFQSMLSERFQRLLADYISGSTAKGIQRKTLEQLKLAQPPLPEQHAIAAVLSDMDAELAALEARRDKTKLLKQAMMQELLTGKIRLIPPPPGGVNA